MVERRSFVTRAGVIARFGFIAIAGIAGLAGGPIASAGAQAPDGNSNPKAEAVLKKTADFYKNAKTLAVDVERAQKVGTFTMKTSFSVAFERPNHFAIKTKADSLAGITVTLVSDGKTLSTAISQLKKYTEAEAPESIDDLKADPVVNSVLVGMMITDLFSSDPYKALMEGVKTSQDSGSEVVDGVKAHHLSFIQDQFEWEIWIQAEGDPVVKKVKVDPSKAATRVPGQNAMTNRDMVTTFKNWKINEPIGHETFVFKAPEGSQKVDSLFGGPAGGAGAKPERSPLVGKAAPKVNLKLLDGGNFQLEDHRDKEVVMMDFWATWCGPCVQELPILADVAKAYKEKGVVFRAVNLQEKPDEIREFLKSKKLDMTVALDPAGESGTAYKAEAIPMLILIDKKGVVQSVHVGYNPAIKRTLQKELDALLAGKDLSSDDAGAPKIKAAAPAKEQ
jgi:thiol-disulfide isomerase/thioredoxin